MTDHYIAHLEAEHRRLGSLLARVRTIAVRAIHADYRNASRDALELIVEVLDEKEPH